MTHTHYVVLLTFMSWYKTWYDTVIKNKLTPASDIKRVTLRVELMLTFDELYDALKRVNCETTELTYEPDGEAIIRFVCDTMSGKVFADITSDVIKVKRVMLL